MSATAQDVLDFWFADENAVRWFVRDPQFDEVIRTRFGATLEAAIAGALDPWALTPHGWLALLIVLDQFSRNVYRGDARAFAQDNRAQALVLEGLERRDDEALAPLQRVFAYLPLEHAEDLGLQWRSVTLFRALALQASPNARGQYENFLDYARKHCEVITRYGRFPHRNAALGRPSTPDELDYLQEGGGF
ncbi:DUF924 family protein [Frateuria sp. GZRR35]|uniref:DUF924 family protein n=1 Tax=unclassified Frateuria TaxID=2648894 RepID=UPI003EDC1A93